MTPRTVLCFGDSNTHGTLPMAHADDGRRLGRDERWTGVMRRALGDGWRVVEDGLPGRTTVHPDPVEGVHLNGLAAVPMAIGSHSPLDAMIVMLGTNDLKMRFSVSADDIGRSLETLVREVRRWTGTAARPEPRLLLVAPPPIAEIGWLGPLFSGGAAKSAGLAAAVERAARRSGAGFLDAGRHIASSAVDGIHYDAAEHARLGRAVAEALQQMFGEGQ